VSTQHKFIFLASLAFGAIGGLLLPDITPLAMRIPLAATLVVFSVLLYLQTSAHTLSNDVRQRFLLGGIGCGMLFVISTFSYAFVGEVDLRIILVAIVIVLSSLVWVDKHDRRKIMYAVCEAPQNNDIQMVRFLCEQRKGVFGLASDRSALYWAVHYNNLPLVKYLFEQGARPAEGEDLTVVAAQHNNRCLVRLVSEQGV
jgi:hypothetical protein